MSIEEKPIAGWIADYLGTVALRELAAHAEARLVVEGPSKYHKGGAYSPPEQPQPLPAAPHEFAFDLTLWTTCRVTALTEDAARRAMREELQCLDVGTEITTSAGIKLVLTEASHDGISDFDLVEIDGEPV